MSDPYSDEQWREWRKAGIGASDIAKAATGLYGGDVAVAADKLGIVHGATINYAVAKRGHRWEHPIADVLLTTHRLHVIGEQLWCEHPDRPHHRATIDGFLHTQPEATIDEVDTLLEIKTRGVHARAPWDYYRTQVHWQMHVTGANRCLIAVAVIDDTDDSIRRLDFQWVDRDPYVIDQLVGLAEDLWEDIQAGVLPEPTDGSTLDIIKAANARADSSVTADLDDVETVIADYAELKERAKAAADALKLGEARIRIAMGEATEAVTSSGRWRVRVGEPIAKFTRDSEAEALEQYPMFSKRVLDRDRFKAEMPRAYDLLKRPTDDRRLTIRNMED